MSSTARWYSGFVILVLLGLWGPKWTHRGMSVKLDHVKLAQKVHNNAVKIESQKLSSAVQIVGTTAVSRNGLSLAAVSHI